RALWQKSWAFRILLQVPRERDGRLDVLLLRGLVATREKDDKLTTSLCVVHAVARTEVDLQLGHAISQVAMLPRVAVNQSIDPHLDASASGSIFEGVDPITVDLGHLHAHARSVSHRIRQSSAMNRHLGPNVRHERRHKVGEARFGTSARWRG